MWSCGFSSSSELCLKSRSKNELPKSASWGTTSSSWRALVYAIGFTSIYFTSSVFCRLLGPVVAWSIASSSGLFRFLAWRSRRMFAGCMSKCMIGFQSATASSPWVVPCCKRSIAVASAFIIYQMKASGRCFSESTRSPSMPLHL
jgi:hypothetical protein